MTKSKKRTKRGRPRIKGCIRKPNGRILRAKTPAGSPTGKMI
ncbi:hypothetical protein [Bartonella sp. AU18XJBT]|nr:hypothetical protein [Bartonella sp. AU18XJBT]